MRIVVRIARLACEFVEQRRCGALTTMRGSYIHWRLHRAMDAMIAARYAP